jgi:dienelactone hydrolase
MRRRLVGAAALAIVAVLTLYAGWDFVRGAALVSLGAGTRGWITAIADLPAQPAAEHALTVPSRHGDLRARLYRPANTIRRAVVLVPGVHAAGIDEPRLVGFARGLARMGVAIVTPELPDVTRYEVSPASTDMIEDAGLWLAGRRDLARDGRVGLMGISFSGGLTVVAAGRPRLRERTAFVFSFGGHGDFRRVLRYLCTGVLPDGSRYPPHDYGVAIILLGVADRLVPEAQVAPLREAILTFLNASHVDMVDKDRAAVEFERARRLEAELPEPAAALMAHVNERDVDALGPKLLPHVEALGRDPALSPERSPPPAAPVYLLHGAEDNVIPAVESELLARRLDEVTEVRLLTSPLITHAELDRPARVSDVVRLIAFWGWLLRE